MPSIPSIIATVAANTLLYKGAKAVKKSLTPDIPDAPEVPSPTPLPDPFSIGAVEGKKRKLAQFYGQQLTRANTVLTGKTDTLGG